MTSPPKNPSGDAPLEEGETAKHSRINFADTDSFGPAGPSREPPPPGSLAAWLAKNQQATGGPQPPKAATPSLNDPNQWWICCDPLPPIPLGQHSATITIGRSRHADVVLPHTQVSRIHGKIRVLGPGRYLYEDNGSSNGSLINGEKQASTELKVGDLIVLGPYEIEIHDAETLKNRSKLDADTDAEGDLTSVFAAKPQAAMTGVLSEVPISEILQSLEYNRKTGTLLIESRTGRGRLIVAEGYPIQATFGGQYHDEALIGMAGLRQGSFEFSASVEPGEPRFKKTITALLLEAARRVDEAR
ncbi:MAG: DUF4388 domain-containing protein [Planctomycetota bacterium]